jgi:hypothetical protein
MARAWRQQDYNEATAWLGRGTSWQRTNILHTKYCPQRGGQKRGTTWRPNRDTVTGAFMMFAPATFAFDMFKLKWGFDICRIYLLKCSKTYQNVFKTN